MILRNNRILIRRSNVNQLLKAVDSHRLVIVVSPLGYGKTTLARQFVDREKKPTRYFPVPADAGDADSIWDLFWRETWQQGGKEAAALRHMGFPANPLHAQHAIDILDTMRPSVFIFDDYHNCTDRAMDAFIETAARSGRDNCHILLFSRTMPEMNFAEMISHGMAVVYAQAFLAFSEAEAKEYFFLNDIVDSSVALNAWKYSEGWAAALWLCLRHSKYGGDLPPSGNIEALFERLVYSTYSVAEKALLKQLSILDGFTAAEAEALTLDGGARQRLARIMNKNAFITRDDAKGRYQLHSIFKTFLQKKNSKQTRD